MAEIFEYLLEKLKTNVLQNLEEKKTFNLVWGIKPI